MKVIATLVLSIVFCGMASAAPMTAIESNNPLAADALGGGDTGGKVRNSDGEFNGVHCGPGPGDGGGGEAPVPEPATMALLGIGLGLAALRKKA